MIFRRLANMNAIQALKYFRKKKKITQAEMLPNKSEQAYFRLETGQTKLTYDDLFTSLNTLKLSFNEFFSLIDIEDNMPLIAIDKQYKKCVNMLDNQEEKDKLLDQFNYLDNIESKNSTEMAIYNDIKVIFHPHWPEIPKISDQDIKSILKLVDTTEYYTYYDYRMVVNPIIFFDKKHADIILEKMYPVQDLEQRDFATLSVANMIYPNIITGQLYKKELESALRYIEKAKNGNDHENNYYFHFQIRYLENLTKYLITKEIKYYREVLKIIELHQEFGQNKLAQTMQQEANDLIQGKTYDLEQQIIPNNVKHSVN
jgi:transcriptional regulator with XRE-family HTH domain